MKNRVSEKTKQNQRRGKGEGASYKPYIKTREVPSTGTGRILKDKITGRQMHLLSQAEVYTYYLLRWDDSVVDIREQFCKMIAQLRFSVSRWHAGILKEYLLKLSSKRI